MIPTGTYTVTRYGSGAWVDGRWTHSGTPVTLTITGSVQPVDERQMQMLPEGVRQDVSLRIYTTSPLRTGDQSTGIPADRIAIDGETYVVIAVRTERAVIPHTLGFLRREAQR